MYLSFTRKLFCSKNKLACAKARGKSPFLSKIIARANLSLSSFSRDYVLIKNYETFNFKF